jgi:hypothetical protein
VANTLGNFSEAELALPVSLGVIRGILWKSTWRLQEIADNDFAVPIHPKQRQWPSQ